MNQLPEVFLALRAILKPYEAKLVLIKDEPDDFYLNLHHTRPDGYQFYFGSVKIKKGDVGYYLMALYSFPDLLETTSEALKKRLHGKTCFHFKKLEPELFAELKALTASSFERFQKEGMA
jgi:hypothetical protein